MDIGHLLCTIADSFETANVTEAAKRVRSPAIPEKFTLTERVLVHMMRENTGASILDSGGAYGRAWQRNLERDFADVEPAKMSGRVYTSSYGKNAGQEELELDVTIDLFTYLASRLDYDRGMSRAFRKFAALEENEGEHWLALMEAFPAWISERRGVDVDNVYTGNSYNEDNLLSGTVQYTCFELDGDSFVLLQIHGGCDVRGGYTAPQVFRTDENCGSFGDWNDATVAPDWHEVAAMREALKASLDQQTFLFADVEAEACATVEAFGDSVYWDIGGNDYQGDGASMRLRDYPVKAIESRTEWVKGTVCVLEDGRVLCPETGAVLCADFMR